MTPWRGGALLVALALALVGLTGGDEANVGQARDEAIASVAGLPTFPAPIDGGEALAPGDGHTGADPVIVVPPATEPGDPEVRALQLRLRDAGHDPGPIDGVYGPRTARAERASQGIVEPAPAPRAAAPAPAPLPPGPGWSPALHAHPFLVCTRMHESDRGDANGNGLHDGGYEAYNGGGPYLGAYQFLQSTWDSTARAVERLDLVGRDPRYAGDENQDLMAWALYQMQGNRPWGGRC